MDDKGKIMADWEEIKKHLEPIGDSLYITPDTDIQLSIAISLKRIADAITKPPQMANCLSKEEYEKMYQCHPGYIFPTVK
jgi:hypothetical protein